jgi:hypothetical protein
MTDPMIRQVNALNRTVGRLQSAHTLAFITLTNSESQITDPFAWTFLQWGYASNSSASDNGIETQFPFSEGSSFLYTPRQGYYNATVTLSFDNIPTTLIMRLYINDVIINQLQQTGNTSNTFSFIFFAEENDIIQFAFNSDVNTAVLSVAPSVYYAGSPLLIITKIV